MDPGWWSWILKERLHGSLISLLQIGVSSQWHHSFFSHQYLLHLYQGYHDFVSWKIIGLSWTSIFVSKGIGSYQFLGVIYLGYYWSLLDVAAEYLDKNSLVKLIQGKHILTVCFKWSTFSFWKKYCWYVGVPLRS